MRYQVIKSFTKDVRNPSSTLNNEKGTIIVQFKKDDIIECSVQFGSLGDLWTISNLTTGHSYSYWAYTYSNKPIFIDHLKEYHGNLSFLQRT